MRSDFNHNPLSLAQLFKLNNARATELTPVQIAISVSPQNISANSFYLGLHFLVIFHQSSSSDEPGF